MNLQSQIEAQKNNILNSNARISDVASNSFKPKTTTKETPSSSVGSIASNTIAPPPPTQNNCVIYICYNGEPRQLAITGQLLQKDEEFSQLPPME